MTISIEELLLRVCNESPFLLTGVNGAVVLVCRLEGRKEHVQLAPEDADRLLQLALRWVKFDLRAKELVRDMDQRSDFAAPERTPVPVDPDLETSAPRAFLEPDPVPRLFTKDENGERRFYLRNADGTIQQLPLAPSPTVESVLTEAARLGIRSPYTAVQKRLTEDELQQALMNVGVDLRCGTCAEIFYTGSSRFPHTCARKLTRIPEVSIQVEKFTTPARDPSRPVPSTPPQGDPVRFLETSEEEYQRLGPLIEEAVARDLAQDRAEQEAVLAEDRTEQARLEELALQEEAEDEARRQSRSWDSDP